MAAFRSVVCAVDTSAVASRVVRHAIGAAAAFGAPLRVLSVTSGHAGTAESQLRDQVRDALPPGATWLAPPEVRVVKLALGAVVDALLDAVEAGDLLVAGTHSKSGLSRWLLGSTSAALLAETPCPALLVPPGSLDIVELDRDRAVLRPGAVMAAVDPSEENHRQLQLAAEAAALARSPLVAMTVAVAGVAPDLARQALEARCLAAGVVPARYVVREGAVADEIDHAAVAEHAGLVVMGLQARGDRGAVATAVLKAKDALVLAVPA